MGWSYGQNDDGRDVGYGVQATCDLDGCTTEINRGLAYCCGGMHDGGERGCGGYFCDGHLTMGIPLPDQMCSACAEQFESDPNRVAAAVEEINREHAARDLRGEYLYDRDTGDIAYVIAGSHDRGDHTVIRRNTKHPATDTRDTGRSRGTPALASLPLRPASSAGDRGLRKRLYGFRLLVAAQVRRLLGHPGEWDEQIAEARCLYDEGKTLGEVARHFGRSIYDFSPWLYMEHRAERRAGH